MHICIWTDRIWKDIHNGGRYTYCCVLGTSMLCAYLQGSVEDPGINQLALLDLFAKIKCSESDWSYSVLVSMLEIYNEAIHDLLSIDNESKLDIKLRSDGFYVPGLTQITVSSLDEVNTVCGIDLINAASIDLSPFIRYFRLDIKIDLQQLLK